MTRFQMFAIAFLIWAAIVAARTLFPMYDPISKLEIALSDGDRSVLREILNRPGSQMVTTAGSPNDALWSELTRRGLMIQLEIPAEMSKAAAGQDLNIKFFSITDKGQSEIPNLLPRVFKK